MPLEELKTNIMDPLLSLQEEKSVVSQRNTNDMIKWLNQRKVRSFYTSFKASSLRDGARHLLQVTNAMMLLLQWASFMKHEQNGSLCKSVFTWIITAKQLLYVKVFLLMAHNDCLCFMHKGQWYLLSLLFMMLFFP